MTAPLPPKGQPQQQPPNQPPINPQKRVGSSGHHGVSRTTSPQFSSGQTSNKNPPPQKSVTDRSVTSTEAAEEIESFGQSPAEQMKVLHKQLTTQMADFWVRDQVTIMHKIMADPDLAAKMGITIKVQLPGTNTPVQVYPIIEGANAPSEEDFTRCEELLQKSVAGLAGKIREHKPVNELFGEYVNTRNQFIALGEDLYPNFNWKPVYERILRTAINKTIETEASELVFIKEQPDSSKTLGRKVLDELARYDLQRLEEEEGEEETPPPQNIKLPKGKSALKNPRVEFRVAASEDDIERHRARMEDWESQTSEDDTSSMSSTSTFDN